MKLYLSEPFRWNAPLPLTEANGAPRFTLTGDAYAPSRRLHVTDLAGREAVLVRQTLPALFPRYVLEVYGKPVGELVRDLTVSPPIYVLPERGWTASESPEGWALRQGQRELAWCRGEERSFELKPERPSEALAALGALLTLFCAARRGR